jgi:hypothetical protein
MTSHVVYGPLDFSDHKRIEIPVKGPDKLNYTLRELTEGQSAEFTNARMNRVVLGPKGKPQKINGMGDLESLLVSMALVGEHDRPVHENTIRGWPHRVVKELYKLAQRISDLDEGPKEKPLLLKALAMPGCPVSLDALREYLEQLAEKDESFEPLVGLLEPDPEERAKNERSGSTAG